MDCPLKMGSSQLSDMLSRQDASSQSPFISRLSGSREVSKLEEADWGPPGGRLETVVPVGYSIDVSLGGRRRENHVTSIRTISRSALEVLTRSQESFLFSSVVMTSGVVVLTPPSGLDLTKKSVVLKLLHP